MSEVREPSGADARLDEFARKLEQDLADPSEFELRARRLVERMALALQGSFRFPS
jgi:putative acyl-CoA dehydrogenase